MSSENYKRVVIEGTWDGDVIPGRIDELLRYVTIRPGARVKGGVLGHQITVEGPAEISAAVYATNDVELVANGDIRFSSGAGARHMIYRSAGEGRLFFGGDVVARSVRLDNAVIRGSVHGDEVRLSGCVVLGVVQARTTAELERTTVLTAAARELTFGAGCALILPYADATRLNVKASVRLALLPDADEHVIGTADIVSRDGRQCLTVGPRLANLLTVAAPMRNVSNLIARLTIADADERLRRRFPVDPKQLPAALRPLLTYGAPPAGGAI